MFLYYKFAVIPYPTINVPRDSILIEGTNFVSRCTSNTSEAIATWVRADGRQLAPAVQVDGELRLNNATSAMEGIYLCNTSNTAGSNTAMLNITVICKYCQDIELKLHWKLLSLNPITYDM